MRNCLNASDTRNLWRDGICALACVEIRRNSVKGKKLASNPYSVWLVLSYSQFRDPIAHLVPQLVIATRKAAINLLQMREPLLMRQCELSESVKKR